MCTFSISTSVLSKLYLENNVIENECNANENDGVYYLFSSLWKISIVKVVIGKGQENNVIAYFLRAYGCFNWYSKN